MTIGGFKFEKKHLIIVGVIILIIIIASGVSKKKEEEEIRRRNEEARLQNQQMIDSNSTTTEVELTYDEQLREQLNAQYGMPPEGFEWDLQGNLIALSDDNSTYEDVVYYYIRSLSILDFSTAQRYSYGSNVIASYQTYYSELTTQIVNYYNDFMRKQFKYSLGTLEILGIEDVATFADGTYYITVKVACLDLTDKDFWLEDKQMIYDTMRVYEETETDSTKANQFLYDYIYQAYVDGKVGKKEHTIELVVSKENEGGFLVSNDAELDKILQYKNGVDVAQYIMNDYSNWYRETLLKESQLELDNYNNSDDAIGGEVIELTE